MSVLLVGALALIALAAGCGSGDGSGKITDQSECNERVRDFLIEESVDHPERFGVSEAPPALLEASDTEILDAIDRTLPEF